MCVMYGPLLLVLWGLVQPPAWVPLGAHRLVCVCVSVCLCVCDVCPTTAGAVGSSPTSSMGPSGGSQVSVCVCVCLCVCVMSAPL